MVRQCAWCLRLIDSVGERLSPTPLPKLYEASHGICGVCGTQWMEQVLESQEQSAQGIVQDQENDGRDEGGYSEVEHKEALTQLILQLQRKSRGRSTGVYTRRHSELPLN
ncbi:hypothetical protein [Tengunoibacter tsumagoiensis]|uniref:Uncharacterized protein n=1 Tax=Tengunoibacter tsumagoiensis TaxID=2014871 RepID=A0A401ZVW8_9CHLR|nr:hypothetical protein [Tengunoibacter tsumagoiensis]GCE10946.1 hypothetical protein KTT_08050 [Tengunoibacter tsumagoiensis]